MTDVVFCAECLRAVPWENTHDGGYDDMGRELLLCEQCCDTCDDEPLQEVRDLDWGIK